MTSSQYMDEYVQPLVRDKLLLHICPENFAADSYLSSLSTLAKATKSKLSSAA